MIRVFKMSAKPDRRNWRRGAVNLDQGHRPLSTSALTPVWVVARANSEPVSLAVADERVLLGQIGSAKLGPPCRRH